MQSNQPIDLSTAVQHEVTGPYKIDARRGSMRGEVSSQWFKRPDDQKFLNLKTLYDFTRASADGSVADLVDVKDVEVLAPTPDDPEDLRLLMPGRREGRDVEIEVRPNHWSFGQLCSLVQTPAQYLRRLPAQIAGINLQYGLSSFRSEMVKAYSTKNGAHELRAATGPEYGRIHDHEVVSAVMRIAGDGTGRDGFRWKVPGVINWRDQTYDPNTPITRESTTLFASDRDVFLFLCDDTHPIEIGKLADGSPDLIFRGFYAWNSEVGSRSMGIATFYMRGACQNRCLWGVEGFQELTVRHSKSGPARFIQEAKPALESFANNNTAALLKGIADARAAVVAKDDDGAKEFLGRQRFTQTEATEIINAVTREEGRPARSIWDFVQGITAVARTKGYQDDRIALERQAGKLLDKVA